jgi:hypothetical protein
MLVDSKSGVMMSAWEKPPADKGAEARIRVAPWDENAALEFAVRSVPFDGNTMGRVFRSEAGKSRNEARPDVLESNQTNAADAERSN